MAEILGGVGGNSPLLPLERATSDALATYAKLRFCGAKNMRKEVAREWDLTEEQARSILEGNSSRATYDRIKKHKRGGWKVVLAVEGAVIGQSIDQFIAQEARRRAHAGERYLADSKHLAEVARDLPSVVGLDRRRSG